MLLARVFCRIPSSRAEYLLFFANHSSRLFDAKDHFASKLRKVFTMFWVVVAMCAPVWPPAPGFDEESHIARAEQIAEGGFLLQELDFNDCDIRLM